MSVQRYRTLPGFLSRDNRQLFTLTLQPTGKPRAAIVFVPPFAEELNKSRRTVACQARQLAAQGYAVTLLDLSGTGDSGGELVDVSWQDWLEDVQYTVAQVASQGLPVILWGLRLGALLACDVAQGSTDVSHLVMWQPALNGEQHIDQFLRYELGGQMLKGDAGFDRAALWRELRTGRQLDVAGYQLPSRLALQIAQARLGDMNPGCAVSWMDIGSPAPVTPAMPVSRVMSRWQESGTAVSWLGVQGEFFWRNVDSPDSPELVAQTCQQVMGL
jgi:exosortase A-associated hydrolase 2